MRLPSSKQYPRSSRKYSFLSLETIAICTMEMETRAPGNASKHHEQATLRKEERRGRWREKAGMTCTARPHLRGEVGVGVLRGAGVELLDDGGAAVAERGVVDAAVGALADEGAVAEVVGDLLELVEGDGGHVDADGLGRAADPGRARSSRPASVACMRHPWIEMRRRPVVVRRHRR